MAICLQLLVNMERQYRNLDVWDAQQNHHAQVVTRIEINFAVQEVLKETKMYQLRAAGQDIDTIPSEGVTYHLKVSLLGNCRGLRSLGDGF